MQIDLSDRLVAAMRAEYPGCLVDRDAVGEMAETICWQHLSMNGRTRGLLAEHPADPVNQLQTLSI